MKLLVFILMAVVGGCAATGVAPKPRTTSAPAPAPASQPAPVAMHLYTMSMCPYSGEVEDSLKAVLDALGDRVTLQVDYILDEKDGQLSSLHGDAEIAGDTLELCAMDVAQDTRRYLAFVSCQNRDREAIPSRWESCAAATGIDRARIQACFGSQQGADLLYASMRRARAAGVRASPTLTIGGNPYEGARDLRGLLRAICAKLDTGEHGGAARGHGGGTANAVCATLPAEVAISGVVLTDARCNECQQLLSTVERNLRGRFFPGLELRRLDYASADGKALYRRLKLRGLPAVLFDRSIERSDRYAEIRRWLERAGTLHRLALPAYFDPEAEICDNRIDDTGNGRVDCDDPTCQHALVCRKERKGHLEVFTMAHCRFCHHALAALEELFKVVGRNNITVDVHFIAEREPDGGFRSLHGQAEVDEGIRQLCAKKHFSANDRYLKYIWCRGDDHGDSWQPCARKVGIAVKVVEKCVSSGEGRELLAEDIAVSRALRVEASPTWFANHRHEFKGVTIDAILAGFCQHNPQVPACRSKGKARESEPRKKTR